MKTQTKIYSGVAVIVLFSLFFYINSNIKENIETKDKKTITNVDYLNNNLNTTPLDLEIKNTIEKETNTDVELVENNTENINKEVTLYAEEILYPEEYDFSFISDRFIKEIGFPVKLDVNSILKLQKDDYVELTFGENTIKTQIFSFKLIEKEDYRYYTIRAYINPDLKKANKNSLVFLIFIAKDYYNVDISLDKIGAKYEFKIRNGIGYYYDLQKRYELTSDFVQ